MRLINSSLIDPFLWADRSCGNATEYWLNYVQNRFRLTAEVHHGLLGGAALRNKELSGYPGFAKQHELAARSTCRSGPLARADACIHCNGHQ